MKKTFPRRSYLEYRMTISLPPELLDFVRQEVAEGRYRTETELVQEAVRLLQQREASRRALREEIRAGMESETVSGDEVFEELERLADELASQDQ
jgi:antitoxin ParD1/3/4